MKVPLLTSGRTNQVLARTDTVEVRAKVYAEGGENGLHTHTDEDHTFFILDGEATFYGPDDRPTVVGRYEGLMIPAGAFYRFQSTGDTNLVLLRFGADLPVPEGTDARAWASTGCRWRARTRATSRCRRCSPARPSARTDPRSLADVDQET